MRLARCTRLALRGDPLRHVDSYLAGLRPPRGRVMAEMEDFAARDGVPIVHWETGRMLAALAGSLDARVLEVGTAIGYSTLHMAEALDRRAAS